MPISVNKILQNFKIKIRKDDIQVLNTKRNYFLKITLDFPKIMRNFTHIMK